MIMTKKLPNLLIVAGDGRDSGKTSMCRRIIMESGVEGIYAIKMSPHFHELGDGLLLISEKEGFALFEETNRNTGKDSSEMLRAGAGKAFYIQAKDESITGAFNEALKYIPKGAPIICESPSLIEHFEPGIFIIMISENNSGRKAISEMKKHDHLEFTFTLLNNTIKLPFRWTRTSWVLL
jgi:hypothetical protein